MTPRHRRIALLTGASRAAIAVPCNAPMPFLAAVAGRLEKRGLLKPDRPIEPTFEECDCTLTIAKLRAAKRVLEEADRRNRFTVGAVGGSMSDAGDITADYLADWPFATVATDAINRVADDLDAAAELDRSHYLEALKAVPNWIPGA